MATVAQIRPLAAGLHVVATPIGTARDITLRALDVLASADAIAAEDTRTARRLMSLHGVALGARSLLAYHDRNGAAMRPKLLEIMAAGQSLAYVSDAGTPLVADPGFALVRDAVAAGIAVTGAPGPSAVLAALTLSGLPTDRFLFAGFLPRGESARRSAMAELGGCQATLVIFESPRRCLRTLKEFVAELGATRSAAVCRELTKKFEEVRRGTLAELVDWCEADPPRGEVVIVLDRDRKQSEQVLLDPLLEEALKTMTVKDAARDVADRCGLPRREVYQAALARGRRK